MTKTLVWFFLAALCVPAHALAGSWAVGAGTGGIAALRAQLPNATTLVPGRALLVRGARPTVRGAAYVENLAGESRPAAGKRRLAFVNTEPYANEQWYLPFDRAWDHWTDPPSLAPVRVAVIDTGIDYSHPEFAGRVAAGASFVGGNWKRDTCGHGTFVAGEIAANPSNNLGIAGLAFNARLLIAKVVDAQCNVSTLGEIDGIRWAVNHGAKIINLSLGGVRDPIDLGIDTYSAPEEAAVEYAYSRGVLVVAAVGNGTQGAPKTPWIYADYPAALPHVLGVSAVREDGGVPVYSNRDSQFNDIAAPGGPIFSTIPRNLIDPSLANCADQPYSDCGPSEFQSGIGTSFAAPQVTAAAALLLGQDPKLTPDQVEWLLERSATDETATIGCVTCSVGRDSLTGWGRLDIDTALTLLGDGTRLPAADAYEPNDDAGTAAHPFGIPRTISATLDYWDDPIDVYSIRLAKGEQLFARLGRSTVAPTTLALWKPGTAHVEGSAADPANRVTESRVVAGQVRLSYRAPAGGVYFIEAKAESPSRSPDAYTLAVAISPAA